MIKINTNMKTRLYILTILVSATTCYAATQSGVIFEVTGANKTSETYNSCSVYAYDGTSQNLTIKAYSKEQYYRYASGSTGNWYGDGSVTYSTSYWYLYQKTAKGTKCTVTSKSVTYSGTTYSYLLTVSLSSTQLSNTLSDNQICLKTDNSSGYYTPNIYIRKEPLNTYTVSFDANGGIIPIEGNMGTTPSGHTTSLSEDQTQGFVVVTSSLGSFRLMAGDCPTREGYTFEGWFTDSIVGEQVYDEIGCYVPGNYWDNDGKWIGTSDTQLYAHWQENPQSELLQGALNGLFSVSANKKVLFSKGNLQYNTLGTHACADGTNQKGTWRFAEHQYDTIGISQRQKAENYYGWVSAFGWGTSGWNSGASVYQPWACTGDNYQDYYPGGNANNDLTGDYAFADWGVYNAILNGGNQPQLWRTLSKSEWEYLLQGRPNAAQLCTTAKIAGVNGMILLPDNFEMPDGVQYIPSDSTASINYSLTEWNLLEHAGAVFLSHDKLYSFSGGNNGWGESNLYYTCTHNPNTVKVAYSVRTSKLCIYTSRWRCDGGMVRLVHDAFNTIIWNNYDGSELEKDDNILYGATPAYNGATPTKPATAQYTYTFKGWDPDVVTAVGDATYTAQFDSIVNTYTITFNNYNGAQLQSSSVAYGQTPAYNGATPLKPATADSTYTFVGWSPEIVNVTGDATYTAVFSAAEKLYSVQGLSNDKNLGQVSVAKQELPYAGFTALEESSIKLVYKGTVVGCIPTLEYSYDGLSWSQFAMSTVYPIATGQTFYLRGNNPNGVCRRYDGYSQFTMTGKLEGCGDMMSMVDSTCSTTTVPNYCFYRLFYYCTALTKAPKLSGTTLSPTLCYSGMFYGCTNLQHVEVAFDSWENAKGLLNGVASTGTFVKPAALPATQGSDYIPTGWTVVDKETLSASPSTNSGEYKNGTTVVLTATPTEHSHFVQWNDNVATNPRAVVITQDTVLTALFERVPKQTGALLGVFAVAADKYVCFAQGNLQYSPNYYGAPGLWQFANTQYEYRGVLNQTDRSIIDLIGWGATGYGSTVPNSKNAGSSDYAPNDAPLTGSNYDWGKYCSIGRGGNKAGLWRTMDDVEWEYLINGRPNAQIHKGKATVANVTGYIFLPEEWQCPASLTFSHALNDYTDNVYTATEWTEMEKAGAVFLPAEGGYRSQDAMMQVGTGGYYWTAGTNGESSGSNKYAYGLTLSSTGATISSSLTYMGRAIRLVCDTAYIPAQCTITTTANPEHGSITGGGVYNNGASVQLTVTPAECYQFVQWSDGNTDNPRSLTITGDATYTAEFTKINYTIKGQNASSSGGSVQVVNP
jgi:uncharacterized repeat protein (TIGR02543 family)